MLSRPSSSYWSTSDGILPDSKYSIGTKRVNKLIEMSCEERLLP